MKKMVVMIVGVILLFMVTMSACSMGAIMKQSCHKCGRTITDSPVEAGGRTYCSYNCYMSEMLFD